MSSTATSSTYQNSNLTRDSVIFSAIEAEQDRAAREITLIPSENYTYPEVLAALGSVLTNKYAEGYPGRRYYAGNGNIDIIEQTAIDRAKALFRADHANVQPLSGSPMNQAAYLGVLEPGDTILAMDLSHGGHLTHGAPVSHMGRIFNFVRYRTSPDDRGAIDYEELRRLAVEAQPKLILCGYTSYPRDYDYAAFKRIADEVGALTMADISHVGGLVAADVLENPFDHSFDLVTTTTHKTLRGPRAGLILCTKALKKKIDASVFPGLQGGPHMNAIAGAAIAFQKATTPEFKAYASDVLKNAKALEQSFQRRGIPMVTGGTDNHLLVLDTMHGFGLDGSKAETLLDAIGLTANKQVVPDDPLPPLRPSGLRIGSPAATVRGIGPEEMSLIANQICDVLAAPEDTQGHERVAQEVRELARIFPVPA